MDAKFVVVAEQHAKRVLYRFRHSCSLLLSWSKLTELLAGTASQDAGVRLTSFIVDMLHITLGVLQSSTVAFIVQPETCVRMADGMLLRSCDVSAMLGPSASTCSSSTATVLSEDLVVLPISLECPWISSVDETCGFKQKVCAATLQDSLSKSIACVGRAISAQLLEASELYGLGAAASEDLVGAAAVDMFTTVTSADRLYSFLGREAQACTLNSTGSSDLVSTAVAASASGKWAGYAHTETEPRDYRSLAIADASGVSMLHKLLARPTNTLPGRVGLVTSCFEYFHYNCDGFSDAGWGCAYRSLQSIMSWYKLNTNAHVKAPSIRDLQHALVRVGDKPATFVESTEWIGCVEASFILGSLLGLECQVLQLPTLPDIFTHEAALMAHFHTKGPVLLTGGTKAYTLAGLACTSDEIYLLILDPHYIGPDNIDSAIMRVVNMEGYRGNAVSWRSVSSFPRAPYRVCIPR